MVDANVVESVTLVTQSGSSFLSGLMQGFTEFVMSVGNLDAGSANLIIMLLVILLIIWKLGSIAEYSGLLMVLVILAIALIFFGVI